MDYEVGSIADMISGNRTPNRPKVTKKPSTPVKPSSPPKNVTPRDNKVLNKAKTPKIAFTPETTNSPRSVAKKNQNKNEFDSPKSVSKKRKSNLFNNSKQQKQQESDEEAEEIEIPTPKGKAGKNKNGPIKTPQSAKKPKKSNNKEEEDDVYGSIQESEDDTSDSEDEEAPSDDEDNEEAPSDDEKEEAASDDEEKEDSEQNVAEGSDEEAEPTEFEKAAAKRINQKERREEKYDEQFVDRTLFVGNIPISIIKKNHERVLRSKFAPYGPIESVRIRNIPVPDFTTKPKMAFIGKKFHTERSTVTAYILYLEPASVEKALVENNSLLEGNHLRVDKCYKTGSGPIDPRKSLFCGGLPFSIEDEALRSFFEKCGDIESVRIIRDKKTQMGKGIAFINFASADGVELALSMDEDDLVINKKKFRVKRYTTDNNKKPERTNNYGGIFSPKDRGNKFLQRHQQQNQQAGKKRDEQGNKNRKRNRDVERKFNQSEEQDSTINGDEPAAKRVKKVSDNAENNEEERVEKKMSRSEKQAEYKGLIAKKKKKMKQSKENLKKKKISKILTQPPKTKSSD